MFIFRGVVVGRIKFKPLFSWSFGWVETKIESLPKENMFKYAWISKRAGSPSEIYWNDWYGWQIVWRHGFKILWLKFDMPLCSTVLNHIAQKIHHVLERRCLCLYWNGMVETYGQCNCAFIHCFRKSFEICEMPCEIRIVWRWHDDSWHDTGVNYSHRPPNSCQCALNLTR